MAFPEWSVPFANNNKILALIFFSFVTTVPAAAVAALFAGFIMARTITRHHLWYGVAIILCITVYSVFTTSTGGGLIESFGAFVVPSSAIQAPMFLAWWLFLPLAAFYFSRRNTEN